MGIPLPPELRGMGEDDVPEFFPIGALDRQWAKRGWECGGVVALVRRDGTPRWTGRAFCLTWGCPECAIRLKNILKARLRVRGMGDLQVYRAPPNPSRYLARVRRKDKVLAYLVLKGRQTYILATRPLDLLEARLTPEEAVDGLPYFNPTRRRQRRVTASRHFWVGINSSPRGSNRNNSDVPPPTSPTARAPDEAAIDIVGIRARYREVLARLTEAGFELEDVGDGESHRIRGSGTFDPADYFEVVERVTVRRRARVPERCPPEWF